MDRVVGTREAIDQSLEDRFPPGVAVLPDVEGRGDFPDVRDVAADRFLFGPGRVEAPGDATGQAAELLLGEAPFCNSTFRWIESRTSLKASAICNPAGSSGPPWLSLRMPRTAAQ
jgi:hypothetical protein